VVRTSVTVAKLPSHLRAAPRESEQPGSWATRAGKQGAVCQAGCGAAVCVAVHEDRAQFPSWQSD